MQWIRDIERFYAFPALSQSVKLYADNVSTALSAVQSTRVVVLIFFLLLTACTYIFYFRPLVWQVHLGHTEHLYWEPNFDHCAILDAKFFLTVL
jgi:hypothetical protein